MFEYKDNKFYDDYFSHLDDFKLIEEFNLIKTEDKNHYIGKIETCGTNHKIIIRVEIPVTFPHNKLMFYTDSLSGYPHLIPNINNNFKDNWFCLNTPFAETPIVQLEEELKRLEGWISRYDNMRFPDKITDSKVIKALQKIDSYSWENSDEILEYHTDTNITFIGDFAYKPEFFNNKDKQEGYFHCYQSHGNDFFIVNNYDGNKTIPYIIVDELPEKGLNDFISLKKYYNWSDETCDRLLAERGYLNKCKPHDSGITTSGDDLNEEEALKRLHEGVTKLNIPTHHKQVLDSIISEKEEEIHKFKGSGFTHSQKYLDYQLVYQRKEGETDEEYNERIDEYNMKESAMIDYYVDTLPYVYTHFLLGIKSNDRIDWNVFFTNNNSAKFNQTKYDLGLLSVYVNDLIGWELGYGPTKLITEKEYFGRGKFEDSLAKRNVAIIGLGAIGSQVAVSLARSGITNFALWDNDMIEPGNICRSTYYSEDFGNSKVETLAKRLKSINSYANVKIHGRWNGDSRRNIPIKYICGDLYANINYKSQTDVIEELKDYDLIIDCTASNELLHLLSYAIKDKELISLCITNGSKNLLMVSNEDGNAFDIRKLYLSKIEQDTKNFYVEGNACYSPKFKALNCDISALVNLAVKELNDTIGQNKKVHTVTWSYDKRGVIADRMSEYKLKDNDINLLVTTESFMDAEDMDDVTEGPIGYILGGYDNEGKQIMVTHFVNASSANKTLEKAYKNSNGIIDYIGDLNYAIDEEGNIKDEILPQLRYKANNENINTNNPLLALRTPDGNILFYLYINDSLVPFQKID